ncbi:MAG: GntR family transcriptional regulator [Oscillospiraceae bacterium]|nr:GntR family transcriptional regulator [Oscillospiraceae bacterium]
MDWQLSEDRPIFQQLYEQLCRRILAGTYPPGSRLPSVRDLAAEAGVNPNTMQRALQQLENAGLAESSRTSGRTVTTDSALLDAVRKQQAHYAVKRYFDETAALGFSPADAKNLILQQEEETQDE